MSGLNLSAFDIIGPAMVGPSSSHTAGAVRIGLIARRLLGVGPQRARIQLHGSFAATGRGHATDRALIAGLLGAEPDDESIPDALTKAQAAGLDFSFQTTDLGEDFHPNSVRIELEANGCALIVIGSSLGGGVVEIVELDGYRTAFRGDRPTLVCWHADQSGFLSRLTGSFAALEANIATLATKRTRRGGIALTIVEADSEITDNVLAAVAQLEGLVRHRCLPALA
jgi:L-serine dehydratase